MNLPDNLLTFSDRVYWLIDQVPEGQIATYGQIAMYAGSPRAARAVGNLLRDSAFIGLELPWHRIINSAGGISFKGNVDRAELQKTLLTGEGVEMNRRYKCKLGAYQWAPTSPFWKEEPP